jgi:ribonucleoside-diphosphate reductase beta chain
MKKNIFEKRVSLKPYEYPNLIDFADAVNKAYWIVSEFNFTNDIQDFHTKLTDSEKSCIERTMLAISQVELQVKTFYAKLYDRMPKSEIAIVGLTLAENEARHMRAYSELLEILGLNDNFESLIEVPEIKGRIKYLEKYLDGTRTRDNRIFTKNVVLFTMFVEHVSLFSQFLIMLSFSKEKNLLNHISNVVDATMLEEQIHGEFGAAIVGIIREENPEWFDDDMVNMIHSGCMKAFEAEVKLLDWIFEKGELDFLPKEIIIEFLKNRFNLVLEGGDFPSLFEVDEELVEQTQWLEVQLKSSKEDDFFYKTSVAYNKKSKSVTEDDLFDD